MTNFDTYKEIQQLENFKNEFLGIQATILFKKGLDFLRKPYLIFLIVEMDSIT